MRVGDKLYCIKNRYIHNLKDNVYTLLELDIINNFACISIESSKYTITKYSVFQISMTEKSDHEMKYLIEDYFLTEQDQRKLKLEKLKLKQ